MCWSALEDRDLVILMLFETVEIQLCSVAITSRATLVPLLTRCGCASRRGLVAGKVLERGMGQKVSPLYIVRLRSNRNITTTVEYIFVLAKYQKLVLMFHAGLPNTQRLSQTQHQTQHHSLM